MFTAVPILFSGDIWRGRTGASYGNEKGYSCREATVIVAKSDAQPSD